MCNIVSEIEKQINDTKNECEFIKSQGKKYCNISSINYNNW